MFKRNPIAIALVLAVVVLLTVIVVVNVYNPPQEPPANPGDKALLDGTEFTPNKDAPSILEDTELARPKD